jgi:hypothetical protein
MTIIRLTYHLELITSVMKRTAVIPGATDVNTGDPYILRPILEHITNLAEV